MKKTAAPKKSPPSVKTAKKPKRDHWTVEFFKRVDAWGDAMKETDGKHSRA